MKMPKGDSRVGPTQPMKGGAKGGGGNTDMAGIGNTMHELHTKSLPRNHGQKVAPVSKNGGARSAGKGAGTQGSTAGRGLPPTQGSGAGDNDGDEY